MTKIAIIIPSRLDARRLPNKPLKLIKNKEMILHVCEVALKTKVEDVIVATPDQKIIDIIKSSGGQSEMTRTDHVTGTDRVFEVFQNKFKRNLDIIINLQGDMPNLDPQAIKKLIEHMKNNSCDIGTLASKIETHKDLNDQNICKVITEKPINIYHHIGIYAFTNKALIKYVNLKRSKLEIHRELEQMRALENNMKIDVGYVDHSPLSVDTEEDLFNIKKLMEN
jgi:3-deoxy-manno-octulosonate cytidylyltransferase (CMP-KDO synthetase)